MAAFAPRVRSAGGSDVAVYRDQLEEIERDRAAGLIGEHEAEAARVEVSRRLIAAADARAPCAGRRSAAGGGGRPRLPRSCCCRCWRAGLYLDARLAGLARPAAGGAARHTPPEQRSIEELVAPVEAHLESNPDDGRGWEVLAPVYARLGRYDDAVKARRNALRLLGANAEREADLGEALTGAAGGVVTAEAKAAFERALGLDANDFRARYFLGLAAEQDGRPTDAAAIWRRCWRACRPMRPWSASCASRWRASIRVRPTPAPPAPRGPSADDVAAAAEMSPEQRAAMVRGMVERLAERLKQDGSDVEGWLRLLRAYMVLGEPDKARAAAGDARRALAGEPDKLRRVDELVRGLGLEG